MAADPRYIVQPLLVKGQSVILFSPDAASGLMFAQQLASDIVAGNLFLGQYPTLAGSILQVADQSRQADWNRLITVGSTVLVCATNSCLDPGIIDQGYSSGRWIMRNTGGSNYTIQVRTANLRLNLTKGSSSYTLNSVTPIWHDEIDGVPLGFPYWLTYP